MFDVTLMKTLRIPIFSTVLAGAALLILTALASKISPVNENTASLKGAPADGSVYFIGNSMFGTGLDIAAARAAMPSETASLAYYDGQYTSMWYSAFRNALLPSGVRPKVVVWGFRPTYAVLPAFRQNRPTVLDRFHDEDDALFAAILEAAQKGDAAVLEEYSPSFLERAEKAAPALARRKDFSEMVRRANTAAAIALMPTPNHGQKTQETGDIKVSDLIVAYGTQGRVQRADALVIDNGERFVSGRPTAFEGSFVPHTAELLEQADISQLVVVFKPVAIVDNAMSDDAARYLEEAIKYLDENGIPYLDFTKDPQLTRDLYAKGDHYTQEGMAYVTEQIVNALKAYDLI